MNTTPQVHAMIVAAGSGSRFGAAIPKQYLSINGKTLLQHSVARLAASHYINSCLVVIAADDDLAKTLNFDLPMNYAIGGSERWHSVRSGLEAIVEAGASATDLILIHDAARPAVPSTDIEKVIEAAKFEPYGAILAAPVADTLKLASVKPKADKDQAEKAQSVDYIKKTIDRNQIWQAQTPQVFRVGELQNILSYVAQHNLSITDEASAFEFLDLPVRLIAGSRQNIKLTYPDDTNLLKAILSIQTK